MPAPWLRLLAFVVPFGLYATVIWYTFSDPPDWPAIQTWAVVLTGAILIWYTWETMQLRYAAHAQRESQIRPYVVLAPAASGISAQNLGNGVALHVRVDTVTVSVEHKIEIRFPKTIPVLRPAESVILEARSYKNGRDAGDFFTAHIDPTYANQELCITLRFDNVELKPYTITQKVSPGSIGVAAVA